MLRKFALFLLVFASQALAGDLDDTARVLAGMQSGPIPSAYVKEVSANWIEYERRIGRPMRQWACRELDSSRGMTVFYPFSGPDLPAAYQLFPDADRYVLVSLQKAGPPPQLENFSKEEQADYMDDFRKLWKFYGNMGFFRTDDLDSPTGFAGKPIGVTGALMAFAVRLGFEIDAIAPMRMSHIEDEPRNDLSWESARFTLRKDGRNVLVDYIHLNLSDTWLNKVPGPRRWLERMAENPTLIKAASHLPQQEEFSILRDILLTKAPLIVQDETGIEYSALATSFNVQLYGRFTRPNSSFDRNLQASLAAAYREKGAKVRPLPFRTGYEKDAGADLQVASRSALPPVARKCP
jgi:hypothetical protein